MELGGTKFDIGFVMSLAGMSTLLLTPISGILGDIYKKKYLLLLGSLGLSLVNLGFLFFDEIYYSYFILRFFQGCCFSFYFVSAGTLVAENTENQNQAQALGFFGVFTIINHALAPTISIEIVKYFSYDYFFISTTLFAFLSFLVIFGLNSEKNKKKNFKKEIDFLVLFKDKKLILLYLIMFLIGGSFLTCLNFGTVFAKSLNILPLTTFFIAYTIIALIMRIFFGWIPDKYGEISVCRPALILYGISIFILSQSFNYWTMLLSGALFGLSHALVYPSIYSLALNFSDENNKTKAFSMCSVSFTFGGMLFSILGGYVAELYSFKIMFLSCSIIVTLGLYFLTKLLWKEIKNDS